MGTIPKLYWQVLIHWPISNRKCQSLLILDLLSDIYGAFKNKVNIIAGRNSGEIIFPKVPMDSLCKTTSFAK